LLERFSNPPVFPNEVEELENVVAVVEIGGGKVILVRKLLLLVNLKGKNRKLLRNQVDRFINGRL
jgi:hypothetical protein